LMGGQPKWRRFMAKITAMGEDVFLEDVCRRIADGEPLLRIAYSYQTGRTYVYRWLKNKDHPERWQAYQDAQLASGGAWVDQGTEILDDPELRQVGVSNAQVALARSRAEWRLKLAEMVDPEMRKAQGMTVNIGTLHLEALRAKGGPDALPAPKPALEGGTIELADYEMIRSDNNDE
jgi:hypothetical protein